MYNLLRVIYWTEVGRIGRARLDNLTDRVYVVSNDEMTRLQGLAVHPQCEEFNHLLTLLIIASYEISGHPL